MDTQLIKEFLEVGCKDDGGAHLFFQVYIELIRVKKFWNVTTVNQDGIPVITAQQTKHAEIEIFVPIHARKSLPFHMLQSYSTLGNRQQRVYLAMVDMDSTVAYYEVSNGITSPTFDGRAKRSKRKLKANSRALYTTIVERNSPAVAEAALIGSSITVGALTKTSQHTAGGSQDHQNESSGSDLSD